MADIYEACLAAAVKEGKISQSTADDLQKHVKDAEKEAVAVGKGPMEAYQFAASKGAERYLEKVGETKLAAAQSIVHQQLLQDAMTAHTFSVFEGLRGFFGVNRRGGGPLAQGIVGEQQTMAGALQGQMTGFIDKLRTKAFGLMRDRVSPEATLRELYNVASGVKGAKENATAWTQTVQWWVDQMKAAGVRIRNMEDWRVFQDINSYKLQAMGKEAYVESMLADWRKGDVRMRDFKSTAEDAYLTPGKETWLKEGVIKDEDRARQIIEDTWEHVTHPGSGLDPGVTTKETMADKYNRRRVFEYPTADAYLNFSDKYGIGRENLGHGFLHYTEQMARDLGMARMLTGDPDREAQTLITWALSTKKINANQAKHLEMLYAHASGQAQEAVNVTLANFAQTARSFLSAAYLHSAVLGAPSDLGFTATTTALNGFSATRAVMEYVKNLFNSAGNVRRKALQMGLLTDIAIQGNREHFEKNLGAQLGQFTGQGLEAATAGMARVAGEAAEFVMRGSLLDHHTVSIRTANGQTMLGNLANMAGQSFENLDPRVGYFLQRYGIDEKVWDILRTKAMPGEGLFMDPLWLAGPMSGSSQTEKNAALKLLGAINAETRNYAVPEGNIGTRAFLLGSSEAGTPAGEARRSAQFLGFGLSVTMQHGYRAIDNLMGREGGMPRGAYAAALIAATLPLGALSLQLRSLATGKDLRNMNPWSEDPRTAMEFWAEAAVASGAFGMVGDQVKRMLQTKSTADAARLLTPTGGLGVDVVSLLAGNVNQAYSGEPTNFWREAVRIGRKDALPRLWYTNWAFDRLVWDTLQRMADPDAAQTFQRQREQVMKDTKQGFWLAPGAFDAGRMELNVRPPALSTAIGARP
jgi:hypothetical protein